MVQCSAGGLLHLAWVWWLTFSHALQKEFLLWDRSRRSASLRLLTSDLRSAFGVTQSTCGFSSRIHQVFRDRWLVAFETALFLQPLRVGPLESTRHLQCSTLESLLLYGLFWSMVPEMTHYICGLSSVEASIVRLLDRTACRVTSNSWLFS